MYLTLRQLLHGSLQLQKALSIGHAGIFSLVHLVNASEIIDPTSLPL
jgi:hypothetical protein